MAEIVTHRRIDDLDNTDITESEGAGRVEFGLHGVAYELDLSADNRATLEAALQPYIDAARRIPAGKNRRRPAKRISPAPVVAETAEAPKKPVPRKRAAKKTAGKKRTTSAPALTQQERAAIRAWAQENGHVVSPRGRIKDEIVEAYNAAP